MPRERHSAEQIVRKLSDAWKGKRWRTDPTPRRGRQVRGPSVHV